ncbi:MAG: hypothetical protein RJB62_235 [Pseudomonadota bacterium]|jgi:phosphatidylglycerophosphatase A
MTKLATLLSTAFGIGYAPSAPGTFASAAALPLGYALLLYCGMETLIAVALIVSIVGIWASGAHARAIAREDPGTSVIDEVAGQLFAMMPIVVVGTTADILPVVIAFFLFRLFDIWKPWPISRLEDLPGGLGIMADDIASGIISAGLLWIAISWNWI